MPFGVAVKTFWPIAVAFVLIIINIILWMPDSNSLQQAQKKLIDSSIKATGNLENVDAIDELEKLKLESSLSVNASYKAPISLGTDAPVFVGGYQVRPLGTIPMDGRTGAFPDYIPPGVHQVRKVDTAYGVRRIPWVLQKATTALAEWFYCVRTRDYLHGLRHADGTLVSPCVGQLRELAQLPIPKFDRCDPTQGDACADEGIHIPPDQCGYSYLGCVADSVADQRWNAWFQNTFLPVFAEYTQKSLRPGEKVRVDDVRGKGFHIVSTCHHVLLGTAPWCGLRTSEFNDWTLDLDDGMPPGRTSRPILPELKRRLYVSMATAAKEPISSETMQPHTPEKAAIAANLGSEVMESAFKGPLVSRRKMIDQVAAHFRDVSQIGKLNRRDSEAVERLKWEQWPTVNGEAELPDFQPVELFQNASAAGAGGVTEGTSSTPPRLFHADHFPTETLDESPRHGSVFLHRVRTRYPVLLAVRRDDPKLQLGARPNRNNMLDYNGRITGFHVCIFGALRNFSSTVRQIRRRYLDTMRPQRIHIVTNDVGVRDYMDKTDSSMSQEDRLAEARAQLFNTYLSIVPFAATLLAVPSGITRKNDCLHCRGAFMKEMARMTLLSELKRNYAVEIVFLFRPDSFPLVSLTLEPFMPHSKSLHVQGALVGYHPSDLPKHRYQAPLDAPAPADSDAVQDADIIQYRLKATEYPYTIVRDRGFVPTVIGYINDINVTKYTVAFHTRVSLGLDFGWAGDPILFGHWNVLNHWMQHFSTTVGSGTDQWEENQSGEKHQYRFFARHMAPLFKLGVEAGVLTHGLDMRIFDFMFSLYRQNPNINYNLFALPVNFAAYQEMTITREYPTKYTEAQCKHYRFIPINVNLTQEYTKNAALVWSGAIGRVTFTNLPMDACLRAPTPPGLPTCYPPFVRVPLSSRNAFKAPCAPFCGHANLLTVEGICLYTGKTGKHPRTFGKPNMATYSETPQSRSLVEGEVQRFNVVFPQSVRRRHPDDLIP